jgi:hypothetical protein
MRLPQIHMSNGAWIFASAVAMAIIAPAVYATATSVVTIGNQNSSATALVTATRQLQTVTTAPTNVVVAIGGAAANDCVPIYTPAAGKAIVVTQVTYDVGDGTQTHESYGVLKDANCNHSYDLVDSVQAYETQSHTFPTGMPMPGVAISNQYGAASVIVAVSGYLIPATQLPPEPPQLHGRIKGMVRH